MALLVSGSKVGGLGGLEGRTLHSRWVQLYDLDCRSFQLLTQAQDVMMQGRFAGAIVCTS